MRITVRLFALQRAQTGLRTHPLELPEEADVATAWQALVAELPVIAGAEGVVRFARNGAYVDTDALLAEGDELAVIPPVAGGAERLPERYRRLEITEDMLDEGLLGELHRAVVSDADGAVAVFVGQTRETAGTPAPGQEAEAARHAGQAVTGLDYEAFEPMAISVLEQIADEIEDRFGVLRMAVVHRIGDVAVGESSVLIVVASPHRAEAFEACRYAIEELKARAPIWKSERFADGSVWLGSPARPGPSEDAGGEG
ncbi:MAG: molybdenum cofactor biosynthesis protein MoaE [Candidatus Limnocylindrales bacterium]